MHRDPVKGKAFEVPEQFLKDLSLIKEEGFVSGIRALCERVEQSVAGVGDL